jgi:sulfur relay (sulfurtransferase) DsrC/TusE family protein
MVESGLFGAVFGMAAMNWSGKVILVLLADEGFEFSEANFAVIDMVRDLVEFVIEKVPLSGLLQKDRFRAWFRERIDGRIIHE